MNLKILTILIIALIFSSPSCMKVPDLLKFDDGEEVNSEEMQTKVIQAWGHADPNEIKQNEFAYIEKSIKIGTANNPSSFKVIEQQGYSVSKIEDVDTERKFHILIQVAEIQDDNSAKLSTNEKILSIAKPQLTSLVQESIKTLENNGDPSSTPLEGKENRYTSIETLILILNSCTSQTGWNVKCYNIKTSEWVEAPPIYVQQQENCAGIPNCQIQKKKVEFDVVVNTFDEDLKTDVRHKVHYWFVFSPDVPYLSRVMDFCYMGIGSYKNQKFPLTVCNKVEGFKFGQ